MKVEKIESNYPYDLLLLADETVEGINTYLFDSDVYVVQIDDKAVGVFCLLPHDKEDVEIVNIAVAEEFQNKGIGSRMLGEVEKIAGGENYKRIILGTADCGFKQIRFYEKNGYSQYNVKKDYFLKKYPDEPIFENGIQLKDMVMLEKSLVQ
ncbi:GNAT family N-acetyltransferase [Dysgonomonas sp. 521]|uniref:GNAT family N-acetyltransferase n=1 Tax=Dysgonomonas sp. 521 TaxID=2302932 RepID=UPI0013D5543C|nr:GNAT family N-acetyltransferase [Dysgonomonas sp. 521]NDV96219.1 GNAT family N-acetyltransferase [Dysgonomonas sp. 521]